MSRKMIFGDKGPLHDEASFKIGKGHIFNCQHNRDLMISSFTIAGLQVQSLEFANTKNLIHTNAQ